MSQTEAIDVPFETVPKEAAPLAVPAPTNEEMQTLLSMGLVLPTVTPELLRRAFAYRQAVYAAILDESDYIFAVTYREHGRERQAVFGKREDAARFATQNASEYRGHPKKSGVVKLAGALGIVAKRTEQQGLPREPKADYASVVYEATFALKPEHTAEGIGMCDGTERSRMTKHEISSTADTRAYNRAVLRLAGFSDVSAEEVIAASALGDEDEKRGSAIVPSGKTLLEPAPLPSVKSDDVMTASRAWAEAAYERGRPAETAAQSAPHALSLRAKARRGDVASATALGASGLDWYGPAQDDANHRPFVVEPPPVTYEDILRAREAASKDRDEDLRRHRNTDEFEEAGGREDGDEPPSDSPPSGTFTPPASDDAISPVEAKALTDALVKKLGFSMPPTAENREASKKWLREHANVETTRAVKRSQFVQIMTLLEG